MKLALPAILAVAASTLAPLPSATAAAQTGDRVLSTCDRFPDFDPKAVQHRDLGPSVYGAWFYDLIYLETKTVLITDPAGNVQCTQPVTTSTARTEHFELSDEYGTPAEIASQVKSWLAARAILRCP